MTLLLFLFAFGGGPSAWASETCKLEVRVHGLRNGQGDVALALFASEEGYPGKTERALRRERLHLDGHVEVTFALDGVKPGTYALSAFHDEDTDGKLGTNFIGIPNEGVAASNDAKGSFGPPKFNDAKFDWEGKPRPGSKACPRLEMKMAYL